MRKILIIPLALLLMSFGFVSESLETKINENSVKQDEIDVFVEVNGDVDEKFQKQILKKLSKIKSKSDRVVFHTLKETESYADYKLIIKVDDVLISPEEIETNERIEDSNLNGFGNNNSFNRLAVQYKREDKFQGGIDVLGPQVGKKCIDYTLKKSCTINATIEIFKKDSLLNFLPVNSNFNFLKSYTEYKSSYLKLKGAGKFNPKNKFPKDEDMIKESLNEINNKIKDKVLNIDFE